MLTQAREQYEQLIDARTFLKQGHIDTAKQQLVAILDPETQTFEEHRLRYIINLKLRELSLEIQGLSQDYGIKKGKVDKVPHLDTTLRANRLGEYMSYPDRLGLVLSPEDRYVKLNKQYLDSEKNQPGYKGKSKNKGAVEDRVKQDFFTDHFVLDPDKITDAMRLYLLDGKSIDDFTHDPQLKSLKKGFARPYFLQYKLPETPEEESQKKATSRIMFFRGSPAIAVFRGADTHPMVPDPTKHQQRKIKKGMDMYVTNSSYDIISQQYQSIQHIMQDQENMTQFTKELKSILEELTKQKSKLNKDQQKDIELVMDALTYQINPQVLMARLYNLSKIPNFNNRIVQENLLQAAINKMSKREQDLGKYLYYMIPQLQALEDIHTKNIENIELLHLNATMCAIGNNHRAFVGDTHKEMGQFDKNNIFDLIERGSHQHGFEQKDHLIGMFYTMHQEIGQILKEKDEKKKIQALMTAIYKHKIIMAAEQFKQDIELGKISKPIIEPMQYFANLKLAIYETYKQGRISHQQMKQVIEPLLALLDKIGNICNHQELTYYKKYFDKIKSSIEPTLQD